MTVPTGSSSTLNARINRTPSSSSTKVKMLEIFKSSTTVGSVIFVACRYNSRRLWFFPTVSRTSLSISTSKNTGCRANAHVSPWFSYDVFSLICGTSDKETASDPFAARMYSTATHTAKRWACRRTLLILSYRLVP